MRLTVHGNSLTSLRLVGHQLTGGLLLLVGGLLLLVFASSGHGQSPQVEPALTSPAAVRRFVNQLGSLEYQQRVRATRTLIGLGMEAEPAVRQGLEHDDTEVRQRCRIIHDAIMAADRSRRLNTFVHGRALDTASFPCWPLLSAQVGDATEARSLLAEALRTNWAALEHFQTTVDTGANGPQRTLTPDSSSEILFSPSTEAARIFGRTVRELQYVGDQQHTSPSVGQITLPLVMSCHPQLDPPAADRAAFLEILHRVKPPEETPDPWENSTFRHLVGSFVASSVEPAAAYQACTLALRHNLTEAVRPASALLLEGKTAPYKLQYAMLTLARFGNDGHRELLYPYLENTDVCFRRSSHSDSGVECQVRDVALAACIQLSGEAPEDYGFPAIQRNSYSVFQPNSVGFVSDVARESALFKFRESHPVAIR